MTGSRRRGWRTPTASQNSCAFEVLFYGTMDRLLDLLTGKDASVPLDRAALELEAIEFPEVEIETEAFVSLLDSHAAELGGRLSDAHDGEAFVRAANQYLFEELGFHGNL